MSCAVAESAMAQSASTANGLPSMFRLRFIVTHDAAGYAYSAVGGQPVAEALDGRRQIGHGADHGIGSGCRKLRRQLRIGMACAGKADRTHAGRAGRSNAERGILDDDAIGPVSYTHLRAH